VFPGSIPIIWSAKKQVTLVARSSIEAEYRAFAQVASSWSYLVAYAPRRQKVPTTIPQLWCDNLSSIALALNPVFHTRANHIKMNYYFYLFFFLLKSSFFSENKFWKNKFRKINYFLIFDSVMKNKLENIFQYLVISWKMSWKITY